jgi:hypothetical protein
MMNRMLGFSAASTVLHIDARAAKTSVHFAAFVLIVVLLPCVGSS